MLLLPMMPIWFVMLKEYFGDGLYSECLGSLCLGGSGDEFSVCAAVSWQILGMFVIRGQCKHRRRVKCCHVYTTCHRIQLVCYEAKVMPKLNGLEDITCGHRKAGIQMSKMRLLASQRTLVLLKIYISLTVCDVLILDFSWNEYHYRKLNAYDILSVYDQNQQSFHYRCQTAITSCNEISLSTECFQIHLKKFNLWIDRAIWQQKVDVWAKCLRFWINSIY